MQESESGAISQEFVDGCNDFAAGAIELMQKQPYPWCMVWVEPAGSMTKGCFAAELCSGERGAYSLRDMQTLRDRLRQASEAVDTEIMDLFGVEGSDE